MTSAQATVSRHDLTLCRRTCSPVNCETRRPPPTTYLSFRSERRPAADPAVLPGWPRRTSAWRSRHRRHSPFVGRVWSSLPGATERRKSTSPINVVKREDPPAALESKGRGGERQSAPRPFGRIISGRLRPGDELLALPSAVDPDHPCPRALGRQGQSHPRRPCRRSATRLRLSCP